MHKLKWHVTARTAAFELFSGSIPGKWEALQRILDQYKGHQINTVYEAGYFGFWLHDDLIEYGAECIVSPPSLIPQEYGNKAKTDRRDNRKSTHFLAEEMLKRIWVPTEKKRYHRQVIRHRRRLIGDHIRNPGRIRSNNRWMQESCKRL